MKSLYILLVALAVSAVSCRTKEGEPGPAGESNLAQQGTISGTLAYKDYNGNAVSVPFQYNYFETLSDNKYYYDDVKGFYQLNFFRRDLKDYNNYIYFSNLVGSLTNGQSTTAPTGGTFEFSLVKVVNNSLFEFYAYFNPSDPNSSSTISNYSFNATTGRLVYDYELSFAPGAIDNAYDDVEYATVTGHVDVILNRSPQYSSPPQAAITE